MKAFRKAHATAPFQKEGGDARSIQHLGKRSANPLGEGAPPGEDQHSYRSPFVFLFLVASTVLGIVRVTITVKGRQLGVQGGLVERSVERQIPQLIRGVPAAQRSDRQLPSVRNRAALTHELQTQPTVPASPATSGK